MDKLEKTDISDISDISDAEFDQMLDQYCTVKHYKKCHDDKD